MPAPSAQIAALAARQNAAVTTAQCIGLGTDPDWIARQVRSGRWQRLHRGVFATYSGPVTWHTRARAALLYCGRDAALSHAAAAHLHGFADHPPRVIDVTIPHRRRVAATRGIRIHRHTARAVEIRSRLAVVGRADTALDLLEQARTDDDAVSVLCAAVRGRTPPWLIREALARRSNTGGRGLAVELLTLVAEGIESPLELRYHRDVEQRHGLPRAALQRRQVIGGLWIRADRIYQGMGVRTELDGQLAHPDGRTDADTWRDNAVAISHGEITLRYRWSHVHGTPCRTAAQVVAALRSRGWAGDPRPCGPGCPVR